MIEEFETTLGNYYGTVGFRNNNGNYVMFLDNYIGQDEMPISKEFYEKAKELFVTSPSQHLDYK